MATAATPDPTQLRDDLGQYAVGFDALCRCGHPKGCHLAGAKGNSTGECIVHEMTAGEPGHRPNVAWGEQACSCTKFRAARKR